MSQVEVIGSPRGSAGVAATVRRVKDALAAAGARHAAAPSATDPTLRLVVDPAAWYAAQPSPPSSTQLARTVGLSLAPYATATMHDDAEVGRALGAIVHPDARSAQHLSRLGCRAVHVPFGIRAPPPGAGTAVQRPVQIMTFGPATLRRLRVIAQGAAWLDQLRCAHHFDEELPDGDGADDPMTATSVLVDVGADDGEPPDPALLCAAVEAGAAFVSERSGDWPAAVREQLVLAGTELLFHRAHDLARDPQQARDLAAHAHAALAAAQPLAAMGLALGELLAAVRVRSDAPAHIPKPGPAAAPGPPAPTVAEQLRADEQRPDAALRAGIQQLLGRVRTVEERLSRLEHGADALITDVLLAPTTDTPPQVSVLIPCFSARWTLIETLESVRATAAEPGAPALEIVLVDDASPQDEATAAVEWAAQHPGLPLTVLRHRHNQGLSAARNTAAGHAAGALVLPLDADDLLRPRGLERLLRGLRADPQAAFAYGILQRFDTQGPTGLVGLYPWDPSRMRTGNYIPALALIRRDALRDAGGYATDMPWGYEDWDLWCRFAERGARGTWVPEIVAAYRTRVDSMSTGLHLSHRAPLADMLARHPGMLG